MKPILRAADASLTPPGAPNKFIENDLIDASARRKRTGVIYCDREAW